MNGRTAKQIRRRANMAMEDKGNTHQFTNNPRYKKNSRTGQVVLFGCFKVFVNAIKKMKYAQDHFVPTVYKPTSKKNKRVK